MAASSHVSTEKSDSNSKSTRSHPGVAATNQIQIINIAVEKDIKKQDDSSTSTRGTEGRVKSAAAGKRVQRRLWSYIK